MGVDSRKNSHRQSPGGLGYAAGAAARRGSGIGLGHDVLGHSHMHHPPAAAPGAPVKPPVLYDLVGLVQHTGGLEHGHYTCFTRDDDTGKHGGGGGGRRRERKPGGEVVVYSLFRMP